MSTTALPEYMTAEYAKVHFPTYFAAWGAPDPTRILKQNKSVVYQHFYDWNPEDMIVGKSFKDAAAEAAKNNRSTGDLVFTDLTSKLTPTKGQQLVIISPLVSIRGIRRDEKTYQKPDDGKKDSIKLSCSLPTEYRNEHEELFHTKGEAFDKFIVERLTAVNSVNKDNFGTKIAGMMKGRFVNDEPSAEAKSTFMKFRIDYAGRDSTTIKDLGIAQFVGTEDEWNARYTPESLMSFNPRANVADAHLWKTKYYSQGGKPHDAFASYTPADYESNEIIDVDQFPRGVVHFCLTGIMRNNVVVMCLRKASMIFYRETRDGSSMTRGLELDSSGFDDSVPDLLPVTASVSAPLDVAETKEEVAATIKEEPVAKKARVEESVAAAPAPVVVEKPVAPTPVVVKKPVAAAPAPAAAAVKKPAVAAAVPKLNLSGAAAVAPKAAAPK